jgi:hypothetical protein
LPDTTERSILNFIRDEKAWTIVGSILKSNFNFGHHDTYLFPEFNLMPNHFVDYLLVGKNSGGFEFVFVEFENISKAITVKDGSIGTTFRKGIKQIEDWDAWLDANFSSTIHLEFERHIKPKTFLPNEFRALDKTRIHYVVVAGRRIDFKERTYRQRRDLLLSRRIHLLHYDNLLDAGRKIIGTPSY